MEVPQGKTDQDREQDSSPAMEVPQGETDRDREQDSSPGDNLQNTQKLKPNNKAGRGETYRNLGIVHQNSSNFHEAIEYHECDLQTTKEGGDKAGQEQASGKLGISYESLTDYHKATADHKCYLQIPKEEGDKAGEGGAYRNLDNAFEMLGEFHKATSYYRCNLKIAKEVGDKAGEGRAYGIIGSAHRSLRVFPKPIFRHERHLQLAKQVRDEAREGRAYGDLGNAYHNLDEFHKAITYHESHLAIATLMEDKAGKGRAYGNLGIAYHNLGDFRKAISYHELRLQIAKEVGDKAGEGRAYENFGNAYHSLGFFHKDISYHERPVQIAKQVGDKAGEGESYGISSQSVKHSVVKRPNSESSSCSPFAAPRKRIRQSAGIYLVKDGEPSNEELEYLSLELEGKWDKLGRRLGFSPAVIRNYDGDNPKLADKAFNMLIDWKQGQGSKATYKVLHDALCHNLVNRKSLAEQFCYDKGLRDFNKAIEYDERHLEIAKEVGDKDGEGRAYGRLAFAYSNLGDFQKAIQYNELHLKIAKEVGNKAGERGAYAIEEDEVPYYTGRKKLADEKDATVDYEENKKTLIKRGKLGGKEDTWHLREAGASIKLNSGAVQQPVPFTCTCLLWNPRTLSPPISSDEILVSSVIELSHDGPPDLEYSFTVALLHSAPNLEGYEVVIKQLTNQENNEWKELKTENTWHGSEISTVPGWFFPFAQAVCSKSGVSSFAAIWRPKSFTFSRGTAVGPELTCIVPDFPDVSVQIPQSCVPVNQDFCVTIQVQEFPSSELKGEEGLVGPVLYISGFQNVTLVAPVTIRIPLTLSKGKQELAELCPGELRILHSESLAEPHDWKDITDQLDEPPRLLDGKVQFKVRHFSGFRPIKLIRLLSQSASDFNKFVRKLCKRSRPQYARFFTCLCETRVRGHFGLKLFCYPQKLQHDVNQQISKCIVPHIGEGTSLEPICGEEEILVSLSEAIIPQDSEEKNALRFVKFRENEVYVTGGEVCLRSVSVPKVKFKNRSQKLLCNVTMVLAFQVPVTVDHEEGSDSLRGISAQSVKHSIVKNSNAESSSCSPAAASGKRKQYIYMVKDGIPLDRKLEELSLKLGKKWKELGSCLEFDDAAITNLDEDNKELARKAYRMLLAWKQREGFQATYTVLYNALCDKLVECKLLAENFCCTEIEGNASP